MTVKIDWNDEMVNELGKITDKEFSEKYSIHRLTVMRKRNSLKIKPLNKNNKIEHKIINGLECKWCMNGHWEPIDNFSKNKNRKDNLRNKCKFHDKEQRKEMRDWQREYEKEWNKNNRDKVNAKHRKYSKTEKGKINIFKKHERQRLAFVFWNKQTEEQMYKEFGKLCAWCGSINDIEREHFIPVVLEGKTIPGNIYPTCEICNRGESGKFGKNPEQWCIEKFGDNKKYLEIKAKLDNLRSLWEST